MSVVQFPGVLAVDPVQLPASDIPAVLRGIADALESGKIGAERGLVVLDKGHCLYVQRLCVSQLEALGLAHLAQKAIFGV